jgi:hypothetical protein
MSEKNKNQYEDYFEFLKAGRKGREQQKLDRTTEVTQQSDKTSTSVQETFSLSGDWSDELL